MKVIFQERWESGCNSSYFLRQSDNSWLSSKRLHEEQKNIVNKVTHEFSVFGRRAEPQTTNARAHPSSTKSETATSPRPHRTAATRLVQWLVSLLLPRSVIHVRDLVVSLRPSNTRRGDAWESPAKSARARTHWSMSTRRRFKYENRESAIINTQLLFKI